MPAPLRADAAAGSVRLASAADDERAAADGLPIYWDDELAALPEREDLVAGIVARDSLAVVVAKWESFKTFFALDLALCVATSLDWHGHRVHAGRVLYIVAEGVHGMRQRVHAWKAFHRFDDRAGVAFVATALRLDDPADVSRLLARIRRMGEAFALVVVDTVSRNMGGDENRQEDMSAFVRGCDAVRRETRATVLAVHHTG